MNELVSVIIPAYNMEDYLERCVVALQNQSYSNIEIIIVDDGSTDRTPRICDELAQNDHRILVQHQENSGLACARKSGLNITGGSYIAFVDADDYVDENYIELLYVAAESNQADLVVCSYYEDETPVCWQEKELGLINRNKALDLLSTFSHGDNIKLVVMWNKLYRRSLFDKIEFTKARIHEDEFMAHWVLGEAEKTVLLPDALYHYCQREGSLSQSQTNRYKKRYQALRAFEERLEYYQKKSTPELSKQMLNTCLKLINYEYTQMRACYALSGKFLEKVAFRISYKHVWIGICLKNRRSFSLKRKIKYMIYTVSYRLYWKLFKEL